MHLVGFIIRIYHDARSPVRQIQHEGKVPEFDGTGSDVDITVQM